MPRNAEGRQRKRYRQYTQALYGRPWMATAEALETLHSILEERRGGIVLTDDEIRLRIEAAGGSRIERHRLRLAGKPDRYRDDEREDSPYEVVNGVAVIPLMGTLIPKANLLSRSSGCTSYQEFAAWFTEAHGRSDVQRIVVDCDSPGGAATGAKDCADFLYGLRGKKPAESFVSGCCASACLYQAAAIGPITASPTAWTGSIGSMIVIRDASEAYAKAGVKMHYLASSPLKSAGYEGQKLEGKQKEALQYLADAGGAQFEEDIAKYRNVSVAKVRESFGQGALLVSRDAVKVGLIDRVATWEEFFSPLAQASPASAGGNERKRMKYSQPVRAALLAYGLVSAMDVGDEIVGAVLAGLFGSAQNESITPEAVLAKINSKQTATVIAQQAAAPQSPVHTAQVVPTDNLSAEQRGRQVERIRQQQLATNRAQLAKANVTISDSQFQAAVDSDVSPEAALQSWIAPLAAQEAVVTRPAITAGPASYDKFLSVAVAALAQQAGGPAATDAAAQKMAKRRGTEIYREDLKIRGLAYDGDDDDVTKEWLGASALPNGQVPLDGRLLQNAYTGGGAYPSALGGVMNVVFDGIVTPPEVTFDRWSKKLPDADDFRPSTVFAITGADQFDLNNNGIEPLDAEFAEESGFIYNDRFNKKFTWNPVMIANDNGALQEGVSGLQLGHDLTLEQMHVNVLTSGTSALAFDNQIIFTAGTVTALTPAARGNRIAAGSGAGPTPAQMSLMRKFGRNQVANKLNADGTTYKRMATGSIEKVLYSSHWEETAEQTFLPFAMMGETKVPVTDATMNRWRGKVEPIYVPLLDEQSDVKYWFAIFGRRAFICHVFQKGFGKGGKKVVFVDVRRGTVDVIWEGRFGCVVRHPQQGMMNDGQ